jgi:hypothetical protein
MQPSQCASVARDKTSVCGKRKAFEPIGKYF